MILYECCNDESCTNSISFKNKFDFLKFDEDINGLYNHKYLVHKRLYFRHKKYKQYLIKL